MSSRLLSDYRVGQLVLAALDPSDFAIAQAHIYSHMELCHSRRLVPKWRVMDVWPDMYGKPLCDGGVP